jgi:hypothetical protein
MQKSDALTQISRHCSQGGRCSAAQATSYSSFFRNFFLWVTAPPNIAFSSTTRAGVAIVGTAGWTRAAGTRSPGSTHFTSDSALTPACGSRVEHTSDEAVAAMKIHNAMQKLGKANSRTAPAEKAKKERKRRKVNAQVVLDPNVEYNQLEASHSANILSLRHVTCFLFCPVVMVLHSGALKRLMMLDLQRIEDEKLLQLPRLNPVAMILDVLSDRELPQVVIFIHLT